MPGHPDDHNQLADDAAAAALLLYVLEAHPAAITPAELRREFVGRGPGFHEADQFARSLRDLERFGLLLATTVSVTPTRAAQHFHRLMHCA